MRILKGNYPEDIQKILKKDTVQGKDWDNLQSYASQLFGWREEINKIAPSSKVSTSPDISREEKTNSANLAKKNVMIINRAGGEVAEVWDKSDKKGFGRNAVWLNPEKFEEMRNNPDTKILFDFYDEVMKKDRWSRGEIDALKGHLIDRNPDSLEEIQVIGGIVWHSYQQKVVDEEKERGKYRYDPEVSRNFAEYNYLISHFFADSNITRTYGQVFWTVMRKTAEYLGFKDQLMKLQSGIMAQVAVHKAMKAIGEKVELSTPKEDVYNQVDLWTEHSGQKRKAIQIKALDRNFGTFLEETEWIDFPSTAEINPNRERHFISKNLKRMNSFSVSLDKYRKETGKDVRAWWVGIPMSSIDFATGDVRLKTLEMFREKVLALERVAK